MMQKKPYIARVILFFCSAVLLTGCAGASGATNQNAKQTVRPSAVQATSNPSAQANSTPQIKLENGVQEVRIKLSSRGYTPITVYKDIPVRFIIEAERKNINGCNNAIVIPAYNVQSERFKEGENVVEFVPTKLGKVGYSCWMGMIRSSITVIEKP